MTRAPIAPGTMLPVGKRRCCGAIERMDGHINVSYEIDSRQNLPNPRGRKPHPALLRRSSPSFVRRALGSRKLRASGSRAYYCHEARRTSVAVLTPRATRMHVWPARRQVRTVAFSLRSVRNRIPWASIVLPPAGIGSASPATIA
jgi:hypothetical protein